MAKKGGLGKGLDAIFYDNAREDDAGAVELSINDLEPNRTQPRQSFDDGAMTELAGFYCAARRFATNLGAPTAFRRLSDRCG